MQSEAKGVVALAAITLSVGYLVMVGVLASTIVGWTAQFGVVPSSVMGGVGIFTAIVAFELSLLFVFFKPGPLLIVMLVPVIVGYVAVTEAASSEGVRKLISEVESRLRTPPYIPFR